jgi:hypothetical protein
MENVERRRRLFGRLCEKGLDGRKKYRDHFGPLRRCSLKSQEPLWADRPAPVSACKIASEFIAAWPPSAIVETRD